MISWRDLSGPAAPLLTSGLLFLAAGSPAKADPAFFTARVAPILERNCTGCHGETKQKSGLRVDSYEWLMHGGESGASVIPGDAAMSELVRRIKLPEDDEDVMPSDGKPHLTPDEIKVIELWVAGGASDTKELSEFPGAPVAARPKPPAAALAPDWHPRAATIAALQTELGIKIVPRSQLATDGLVIRTASAPARCDDAALAKLSPLADLIVEAELARTKVTDAGMATVASWPNLRFLDLTRTSVSSSGAPALIKLPKLQALNLTQTSVDAKTVDELKTMRTLRRLFVFGTAAMPAKTVSAVEGK